MRLDPNEAVAYRNRGAAKGNLGQYAESIADCDQSLRLDPNDAAAYHSRGTAKAKLGQYVEAIAERMTGSSSSSSPSRQSKLRQYADAIADYDQALRLNPNNTLAYLGRGIVKAALEQYAAAIADYDQALRLDPNYTLAYNLRKWCQSQPSNNIIFSGFSGLE